MMISKVFSYDYGRLEELFNSFWRYYDQSQDKTLSASIRKTASTYAMEDARSFNTFRNAFISFYKTEIPELPHISISRIEVMYILYFKR